VPDVSDLNEAVLRVIGGGAPVALIHRRHSFP
jgi:hypothetical protein